jgi:DNA-directed RNA polymerase subunit RPC12/RpoP
MKTLIDALSGAVDAITKVEQVPRYIVAVMCYNCKRTTTGEMQTAEVNSMHTETPVACPCCGSTSQIDWMTLGEVK